MVSQCEGSYSNLWKITLSIELIVNLNTHFSLLDPGRSSMQGEEVLSQTHVT